MVKKILIVCIVLFFIPLFGLDIFAEESDMPDEYDDFLESLPSDILELLPEGLLSNDSETVTKAIQEMTSWDYILNIIFEIIGLNIQEIIKFLATLISVLAISSLFNVMKKTLKNDSTANILQLISSSVLITVLIELSKSPLEKAMTLLNNIKISINTLSPLMCTMYAMGGNISSALVSNYGLIVFLTLFENICIFALEMILGICVSIALASFFINDGNLFSLSAAIKKTFTFFVGLMMLVFTTVISTQTLLSSRADTLTSKTAKLFIGQIIPLVGSTIGETLKTAGASIEYLRSSIGVFAIIILSIMILPTVISILLYRLVFIVSNAVAGVLDCRKEGGVFIELSSIYGYALAVLSISAVALLFLITIFAKITSPFS